MKPRIIRLTGPASSPITIQAEIFDDKFSNVNANCDGDEGEEFMQGEDASGFSFGSAKRDKRVAARKAKRAARKEKRVARRAARKDACKPPASVILFGGPIGILLWKRKCKKDKEATAGDAAASTDAPVDPNAPSTDTSQATVLPDPNQPIGQGPDLNGPPAADGSQDAQDALEDRDESAQAGGDQGDGGDDGSGEMGDESMGDDSGGDQPGSDDGMDSGDNEAMGSDGGDESAPTKHKHKHGKGKKHKTEANSDDDQSASDDQGDSGNDDSDLVNEASDNDADVSEDDVSEVAEFAGRHQYADGSKPKVSVAQIAKANKVIKLHDNYMKKGTNKLLDMAKAAGVTPPSLGGDHTKWEAFTKTALKKITPFHKVVAKLNKKSSAEGGVMIGTHKEEPNAIFDRYEVQDISAFGGDMAFSPEGGSDDISLFGSEPLSSANGSGRKGMHKKHGRKTIRYTGVPKDNLKTPLMVKKGTVTVVSTPLHPVIEQNKITIPADKTISEFTGTGLIGLDDAADYDARPNETFFLGADGEGKEKSKAAKLAPIIGTTLLVGGLILAYYAFKSANKEA